MVSEDFERRFSVWVVSGLVLKVLDTNLIEEGLHNTEQVVKSDALVNNDTFDLMELSQMRGVESLVSEHTIDGEVLHGLELFLLSLLVEHLRADCGRVSSKDVFHCFLTRPARTIANGAFEAILVSVSNTLLVFLRDAVAPHWVLAEEGILQVASWMALRLEQSVEVPEGALNPSVGWHLIEAHRQENLAELSAHFQKWVQVASLGDLACSVDVSLLELSCLPFTGAEHLSSELGLKLDTLGGVVDTLGHFVRLLRDD